MPCAPSHLRPTGLWPSPVCSFSQDSCVIYSQVKGASTAASKPQFLDPLTPHRWVHIAPDCCLNLCTPEPFLQGRGRDIEVGRFKPPQATPSSQCPSAHTLIWTKHRAPRDSCLLPNWQPCHISQTAYCSQPRAHDVAWLPYCAWASDISPLFFHDDNTQALPWIQPALSQCFSQLPSVWYGYGGLCRMR